MQKRNTEELFSLVKAMSKTEKRNFSLYAKRNIANSDLKVLNLYRVLDTMHSYDERSLIRRFKPCERKQLHNLKQHLFNLLLDSLRLIKTYENIDMQLHKLMDHARVLYEKGFPGQALKMLHKIKTLASYYHQVSFLFQVVVFEKKIELVHGNSNQAKIASLNKEMEDCNQIITQIGYFSNLSMVLYGLYTRYGFGKPDIVVEDASSLTFYPRQYYLQAKCFYHLLRKEHKQYFWYASQWVQAFDKEPQMKIAEQFLYTRAICYLNEAAYLIDDLSIISETTCLLKNARDPFFYTVAQINLGNIDGVDSVLKTLNPSSDRCILLCYKTVRALALQNQWSKALDYINRVVNTKCEARLDLQYLVRLLQIQAHRQLGNEELEISLIRSLDRWLSISR